MAISRVQKESVITETKEFLKNSKLTLIVNYHGVSVDDFQILRREADEKEVVIKVIKNKLIKRAFEELKLTDQLDLELEGMLVYVFNFKDEVSGAQIIKKHMKNMSLQFVGAVTENSEYMDSQQVLKLAGLPSKDVLIGQLLCLLQPLHNTQSTLGNGLSNLLSNLKAHKS